MKKLFKILALLLFFINGAITFSQTPIYYTIGENELNNVDIYSILETKNGDVYISTDNGLYKYSNGTFFRFAKLKNQKGNSLFSLVKTTSGIIFCSNLEGQIFKIHNNQLELFYTIPKALMPYFPHLLTDKQGNLIVISKQIIILTNTGEHVNTIKNFTFIDKNVNEQIIVGTSKKTYYFLHKEEKQYQLPDNFDKVKLYYQKSILQRNLLGKKTQKRHFKTNEKFLIDENRNSIIAINPSSYLIRFRDYGVQEIKQKNNTFTKGNTFFNGTFISSFAKGESETLYFGTFKRGLFIVPNYNFKTIKTANKARSIVDFDVKNDNEIYLHIRGNGLFHYNNKTQKTTKVVKEYVNQDVLCNTNIEFQKSAHFPDVFMQTLHQNKGYGGVKDIAFVSKTAYLAATSIGLVFKGDKLIFNQLKKKQIFNSNASFLTQISGRCSAVKYQSKTQTIYVATQSKLLSITKGIISEITYKNKPIIANSLVLMNNELFIGSQQQGVLKYKNGIATLLYNKHNGLAENTIKKIAVKGNYLFVLNTHFLQYINTKTHKIKPLNKGEGVIGYINEFHLSKNKLWVLTDNTTIMSMSLHQLEKLNTELHFKVDSLQMNTQLINTLKHNNFSHYQHNFNFFFHLKNDSHREQTQIKYCLKGFDDVYNSVPATTKEIAYKKLPSGTYNFIAYAQYGTIKSNKFAYTFTIHSPFWQTWWFMLLCVLVALILVVLFFKYRLKKQEEKAKEKLKQQQIQTDLIEAKLTALRSQMNPHFIFNSLNSIQNLILKQDSETSYDYVVLFSRLVRNTLNYSEEEFITLQEEMDFLDVYLQLEKLRFGNEFCYTLQNNCNEHIEIPSLLIQPFVENALLHGLLSKKGQKKLDILFYMEENQLICTITDNGIGRVKATEIQQRQGVTKKSFALNAIQKRLDILKEQYGNSIGYSFIDLQENNLSTGTKVVVLLPFIPN